MTSTETRARHDLWISLLALVSVGIGLYELGRPPQEWRTSFGGMTFLDWTDLCIVGVFIWDFVKEARRHGDWRVYVRNHWWELPSLIPITGGMVAGMEGVALIRGVRLVRLIRLVRLLRITAVLLRFRSLTDYLRRIAERSHILAFVSAATVMTLTGAFAIMIAESRANPDKFAAFDDCLWWAFNMFTNVAYLDSNLQTGGGRIVAAVLQLLGLFFNGGLIASIANAVFRVPGPQSKQEDSI